MLDLQIKKALALQKCTFLPGSFDKRFAGDIASIARNNPTVELSQKQIAYLTVLFHKYRNQLGKTHSELCGCQEAQAQRKNNA